MVNKVYLDGQGHLVIWVIGDQTQETVREMGEKIGYYVRQLRAEHQPVFILDNLIKMGNTTSEARREVAKLARQLDYDRGAMVGNGSMLMRHGTNLMLQAVGRSNVRYFGNEETAIKWLRTGAERFEKQH